MYGWCLSWMNSNKLMLNTDKTEVMTVGAYFLLRPVDRYSANIGGTNTPFKTSVKYLWVKIDQTLSIQDQISSVCRASVQDCNFCVPSLRRYTPNLPFSASLCTYQTSRTLRSSSEKLWKVPKRNLKSVGERSFSFIAPSVWNLLPAISFCW